MIPLRTKKVAPQIRNYTRFFRVNLPARNLGKVFFGKSFEQLLLCRITFEDDNILGDFRFFFWSRS